MAKPKTKPNNLPFVLKRIGAGDRVKIHQDYYGCKRITLSRRWLPLIKTRVDLAGGDWEVVKAAIAQRREPAVPAATSGLPAWTGR
jgi:hypothetical protein